MNTIKMKIDSSFYKSFFFTWAMLVFQNVITLSVNLADNMMLGAYSETALSGVAKIAFILSAQTFLIILSVIAVGMSYQMPTNTGIIRGRGVLSECRSDF